MLFKLTQARNDNPTSVIDIATSIDRLNFSALDGSNNWAVLVMFATREECIARVIWEPAAGYRIHTEYDGMTSKAEYIGHGAIVPSVKNRLQRLFRERRINPSLPDQPVVVVRAIV